MLWRKAVLLTVGVASSPEIAEVTEVPGIQLANSLFPYLFKKVITKRLAAGCQTSVLTLSRQADSLVSAYFEELLNLKNIEALQFRTSNAIKHAKLSDVDLEFLSIPASTATVEWAFGVAGDVNCYKDPTFGWLLR